MNKLKNVFKVITIILFVLFCNFSLMIKPTMAKKYDSTTSEIIIETSTNRILHEKNSQVKKYMASTTKILTAIVIIENCGLDDIITISKETVGVEGSSIYLMAGEQLTVKDLLYGLMLRSGNDCAETLAVYCCGNINSFSEKMNDKAKEIGTINSNFTNPHGLHDDNHYTTAYDLALISSYAMKNEVFREIVSTKSIVIKNKDKNYARKLINKNKMLTRYDGATGIKTGYTKKAGRCLVTSCNKNGMELISVVLNCQPMFERSTELMNYAYDNFNMYKLIESDNIVGFTSCNNKKFALGVKKDIVVPLTKNEYNNIKVYFEYPEVLSTECEKDVEIGLIKICNENNLLFIEKIYTI